jgi:2-keto-3-deoxy-L-rhamnonate aldolase RhmA
LIVKASAQFRTRALAREWLVGSWLNLGSPITAELAGTAGFDWVMLDYEHGPGSEDTLLHQLQALAGTPAFPVVRIAANEAPRYKRSLDLGAQGIMVPFVNTVTEAEAAVAAMRFPPRGTRGVAKNSRASGFGADFEEYYRNAHDRLLTLVQIETADAVANIDGIAAVDGVDVLFVGPTDLTYGLGIRDQYDHPDFLQAMQRVVSAAKKYGKAAGILAQNPAFVTKCREWGFTFVAFGSDGAAVRMGLLQNAATLRGQ